MGDYQARFCERFRGETPLYLLDPRIHRTLTTRMPLLWMCVGLCGNGIGVVFRSAIPPVRLLSRYNRDK
jgi:hypothetical protein